MTEPLIPPLEERIFMRFNDEPWFTFAQVEAIFPDEHPRSIYRAIDKLEETQRIRFLQYHGRRKAYTTAGISQLPMLKNAEGQAYPISELLPHVTELYDEQGRLRALDSINELIITMMQLFVIAQDDDDSFVKKETTEAYKQFITMRTTLLRLVDNINAVIHHPAMQGDPDLFRRVFASKTDKEVPSPEALLRFRTWLAKIRGV